MEWIKDDGGRAAAGFKGHCGDCVTRSIAIVTGRPYQEVYDALKVLAKGERPRRGKRSSIRDGVRRNTVRRYLQSLGYRFTPTMGIGTGCRVHLHDGELPSGRLIVSLSGHFTAVIDGVIRDTFNPQRETHCIEPDDGRPLKAGEWRNSNGICRIARRCVYGYWQAT